MLFLKVFRVKFLTHESAMSTLHFLISFTKDSFARLISAFARRLWVLVWNQLYMNPISSLFMRMYISIRTSKQAWVTDVSFFAKQSESHEGWPSPHSASTRNTLHSHLLVLSPSVLSEPPISWWSLHPLWRLASSVALRRSKRTLEAHLSINTRKRRLSKLLRWGNATSVSLWMTQGC